jgi:stromal membrane-associated protein
LTANKDDPSQIAESKTESRYNSEDLFKDSPSITNPISEKPQKDVKNDIMNHFEKVFVKI